MLATATTEGIVSSTIRETSLTGACITPAFGNVSGIFPPENGSGEGVFSSKTALSLSDETMAKNWENIPEDAIWTPVITVPATVPKRTAERTIHAVFFSKLFFLMCVFFSFLLSRSLYKLTASISGLLTLVSFYTESIISASAEYGSDTVKKLNSVAIKKRLHKPNFRGISLLPCFDQAAGEITSPGPPVFSSFTLFPGLIGEAAVVSVFPGPWILVAASVPGEGDNVPLGTVGFNAAPDSPG